MGARSTLYNGGGLALGIHSEFSIAASRGGIWYQTVADSHHHSLY